MKPYRSTKTFGHELGLSACFRQWRADSHCGYLHGYALAFTVTFEASRLDERNWVMDFGGLKQLESFLAQTFDHKLLIAEDDPQRDELCALAGIGCADVLVLPAVGCEAFARLVFDKAASLYNNHRLRVLSVECREHGANSAIYLEQK